MRRFARDRHVFFVEEPVTHGTETRTVMRTVDENVHVVSLYVPGDTDPGVTASEHRRCVASVAADRKSPLLWVYSPSAFHAARDLDPSLVVYDCVADHGARRGAGAALRASELDLLARADLVFTAGLALFDAKRGSGAPTYPLPSSVDAEHFALPRARLADDVVTIAGPSAGFLGPIDDRVDLRLVDRLAEARPELQIFLLGGLVGVPIWDLPHRTNVHWLGAEAYPDLPRYVSAWDVAIVPFHSDAATRRTEPSGLLACIAAGKPVVTTPLDEVAPYADRGLAEIVEPERFVVGVEAALAEAADPTRSAVRRTARDGVLARTSWDRTVSAMLRLVGEAEMAGQLAARRSAPAVCPA